MKPGILLGSFDPPTNGHIHLISEALIHGVPEIYIIPAWKNPWKEGQTEFLYRYSMCRMIQDMFPRGKIKTLDIERYIGVGDNLDSVPTWETLKALEWEIGEFMIIITNETYLEIPVWSNGEEILKNYEFLIFSSEHLGNSIPGSKIILDLPVSSSMVRERLKLGQPCQEYIPERIYQYIKINNLYEKISIHN